MKKLIMIITVIFLMSGCNAKVTNELVDFANEKCENNDGLNYVNVKRADYMFTVHCNNGATFGKFEDDYYHRLITENIK